MKLRCAKVKAPLQDRFRVLAEITALGDFDVAAKRLEELNDRAEQQHHSAGVGVQLGRG
jgi:hypothetical protein